MSKQFKPLLAATVEDVEKLHYPLYASAKIDGIRCLIKDGKAVTRTLKPIQNNYVREFLSRPELDGLDGEVVVNNFTEKFQVTSSGVMSRDGEPNFLYGVFDWFRDTGMTYRGRLHMVKGIMEKLTSEQRSRIVAVNQCEVKNPTELLAFESRMLQLGYEGLILRSPLAEYKYGRSSLKEGILLKLKRFEDDEAEVIGFEERHHNDNEATTDNLGHTERSSHKENLRPAGDLGALVVVSKKFPAEFRIGTGFNAEQRIEIWKNQSKYKGKLVKYKYLTIGVKDLPRHPVFLGWRDRSDL